MTLLPYAIYDVFTDAALSGNPLAVVFDADRLDTQAMQAIAGEFNLSETIFVQTPEADVHTARVRIFTPKSELPFAGHPTVGVSIAMMERQKSEQTDRLITLEEPIGLVRVAYRAGAPSYAEFDVPVLARIENRVLHTDQLAAALGLGHDDMFMENHEPLIALAGNAFAFVPVSGLDAMRRISVNPQLLYAALPALDDGTPVECFVYCREAVGVDVAFHGRMFAPSAGIPEDPATGSAIASFSRVIEKFDGLVDGPSVFWIEQGLEMGRPSRIRLEISAQGGAMTAARIGGHAVKVAQGELLV